MLLWAQWLQGKRTALLPVPLLAVALFLASSRGAVLTTLAACTMLWAVQGRAVRSWAPRMVLAVALAAVGLVFSVQQVQKVQGDERTRDLLQHQTAGLLNPLDEEHSTVHIHTAMVQYGLQRAYAKPLGYGLGATTIAASKYGKANESTDLDLFNLAVSLGWGGGLLYAVIIPVVMLGAFENWRRTRSPAALGILGILVMTLGHWLNGGQYALALLVWISIGVLDRERAAQCGSQ
jgi:hypothetical protein